MRYVMEGDCFVGLVRRRPDVNTRPLLAWSYKRRKIQSANTVFERRITLKGILC